MTEVGSTHQRLVFMGMHKRKAWVTKIKLLTTVTSFLWLGFCWASSYKWRPTMSNLFCGIHPLSKTNTKASLAVPPIKILILHHPLLSLYKTGRNWISRMRSFSHLELNWQIKNNYFLVSYLISLISHLVTWGPVWKVIDRLVVLGLCWQMAILVSRWHLRSWGTPTQHVLAGFNVGRAKEQKGSKSLAAVKILKLHRKHY